MGSKLRNDVSPLISRPSKSSVQIRVGYYANGQPKYEIRSVRDLKVAHLAPEAEEASRPKRGRPPKPKPEDQPQSIVSADTTSQSEPDSGDTEQINKVASKQTDALNSNTGGRIPRSTRNPNPLYVDAIASSGLPTHFKSTGPPPGPSFISRKPSGGSATPEELLEINNSINGVFNFQYDKRARA